MRSIDPSNSGYVGEGSEAEQSGGWVGAKTGGFPRAVEAQNTVQARVKLQSCQGKKLLAGEQISNVDRP